MTGAGSQSASRSGLTLHAGQFINRVKDVICREVAGQRVDWYRGTQLGTNLPGSAQVTLRCPDDYAVIGVEMRSADWTDGMRLVCQPLR